MQEMPGWVGGRGQKGIEDISNDRRKKKKMTKTPFVILLANQSAVFCACCILFYATCQSINGKCIKLLCVGRLGDAESLKNTNWLQGIQFKIY